MYCQKCGKQIADGSVFCQHCGAQIGNVVSDNFSNQNANQNYNVQHTEKHEEPIKNKEEFIADFSSNRCLAMSKVWKDKSKLCRNMRLRHKKAIKQQAVQIAYSLFLCGY